ncbi:MAG TPA: RDD family protein [Mucilaginibacter sp.]|nr:RDD family protein [Mucilaginibacter sp.]
MEIVKITTAQNIQIEYELAGLGKRVKARCIDYALFFAVYMLCILIFFGQTESVRTRGSNKGFFIALAVWGCLCILYDLLTEVFFNGQSIGKKVAKIKVISLNGDRPGVGQYLLRWVFRLIDFGMSLGSLAVVMVSFSDKKQRIGDLVAGTTVVSTQPITQIKDLLFGEPEPGYVPIYRQVIRLTDRDITLIHEVIKNFNRTRNNLLIYKLALHVRDFLQVTYPPDTNDYQFLEIIVNDYQSIVNNISTDILNNGQL